MTQPVILQKDGQLRIRGATFFTAEAVTRRGQTTLCPLTRGSRLTYSLSLSARSSGGFPYRDPYTGLPPPPARCDRLSLRPVSIIAFFAETHPSAWSISLFIFAVPFGPVSQPFPRDTWSISQIGRKGQYESSIANHTEIISQAEAGHGKAYRFCSVLPRKAVCPES